MDTKSLVFGLGLAALLASAALPVLADRFLSGYGPEAVLLAESRAATRTEGRLVIVTSEKTVTLEDEDEAGERFVKHHLVGRFEVDDERIDYVVFHRYWEGHGYSIVNGKNGEALRLDGRPHLSPDGKRYLTASMDLEAGYDPNRVQIIRVEDLQGELTIDSFFQPERSGSRPSGPSNPAWISEREIIFVKNSFDDQANQQGNPSRRFVLLERIGEEWQPPRELR